MQYLAPHIAIIMQATARTMEETCWDPVSESYWRCLPQSVAYTFAENLVSVK
jgi:hypothetical protein